MIATEQLINTLCKMSTELLKEDLLEILSVQSYTEGKIVLSSGKESNYYIDGKQTTLDAKGGTFISLLFLRMLKEDVSAVGGLSVGADPLASGVSQIGFLMGRQINAFYVRKEPKKHGTSKWIEGPLQRNIKVAILEDVVTTGGSSMKAIEKVIDHGCSVEQILSVVDRNEGGRELFRQKGFEYTYIFDIKEIIERAKKKG